MISCFFFLLSPPLSPRRWCLTRFYLVPHSFKASDPLTRHGYQPRRLLQFLPSLSLSLQGWNKLRDSDKRRNKFQRLGRLIFLFYFFYERLKDGDSKDVVPAIKTVSCIKFRQISHALVLVTDSQTPQTPSCLLIQSEEHNKNSHRTWLKKHGYLVYSFSLLVDIMGIYIAACLRHKSRVLCSQFSLARDVMGSWNKTFGLIDLSVASSQRWSPGKALSCRGDY